MQTELRVKLFPVSCEDFIQISQCRTCRSEHTSTGKVSVFSWIQAPCWMILHTRTITSLYRCLTWNWWLWNSRVTIKLSWITKVCKGERVADRKLTWVKYRFFTLQWKWDLMKRLIHWNANRNYYTHFFFLPDIFVLNTPFSSPKVSLRTSSEGGKHWAVFFLSPLKFKPAGFALNGTLCASLLVFQWVWGHTGRQDWGLSSNEREGFCKVYP